jgi:hypothetical protein
MNIMSDLLKCSCGKEHENLVDAIWHHLEDGCPAKPAPSCIWCGLVCGHYFGCPALIRNKITG